MTITTKQEIRERTERVATKCYFRIKERDSARRAETSGKSGLTTLQRMDIYQCFRDKACSQICPETMFWADYYDLFDAIYDEVASVRDLEILAEVQ